MLDPASSSGQRADEVAVENVGSSPPPVHHAGTRLGRSVEVVVVYTGSVDDAAHAHAPLVEG